MKKINKKLILFLLSAVFVIGGMVSGGFWDSIKTDVSRFVRGAGSGWKAAVAAFTSSVDEDSARYLSYYGAVCDANSVRENVIGTRIIEKDKAIMKADSGSLVLACSELDDEDVEKIVASFRALQTAAAGNGAGFLYCAVPSELMYEAMPGNAVNTFERDYSRLLSAMDDAGVPVLDFGEAFMREELEERNVFYYTDHHWTTRAGFMAAGSICRELQDQYGFAYDESLTDICNYDVTVYPDWFLGSNGKKTGTWFTWRGPDDFELITPKFETNLSEEQPFKDHLRTGSFEKTFLYMENMEKDLYHVNTYATYSGGDFRLQIMRNLDNPDGKKILMIRDSFACAVAPFLALQTSELHLCDIRSFSPFAGQDLDLAEYIARIDPDYVIVLYAKVEKWDNGLGKYNFF